MKKVQKKLLAAGGARTTRDDVAPAWFAPAMHAALHDGLREALKNYPTKDDLEKRLDEKLSGFATKDDLERKLSGFVTKKDFQSSMKLISQRFDTLLTIEQFNERMDGYPEKRTVLSLADQLAGKIKTRDEEDDIFRQHLTENEQKINNHEKRIQRLEGTTS